MNSKRLKDSLGLGFVIITGLATIFTVIGFSSKDALPLSGVHWFPAFLVRAIILVAVYCLISFVIWLYKGHKYKDSITLRIGKNKVIVKTGDIFSEEAWRVIPVDTHFDTVVDNDVISEDSLHGQLVLKHGDPGSISAVVKKEAEKRGKKADSRGKYTFDLGKAIPYEGKDGHYIMIALTSLNKENEARTSMALYETTLMVMWREINRVYSGNKIAIPLLGNGITRFDDNQDEAEKLLRCMLCTLNTSNVHFKSDITVVIYHSDKENLRLPLYEFKDIFRIVR